MRQEFLKPQEKSLEQLFQDQYRIPVYQRPYSWEKLQVKQLLDDIDEAYRCYFKSSNGDVIAEDANLFLGTMFIMPLQNKETAYSEYEVIDGQQRITTLILLLMVLLNHCYIIGARPDLITDIRNLLWKVKDGGNREEAPTLILGNLDDLTLRTLLNQLFGGANIVEFANKQIEKPTNNAEMTMLRNLIQLDEHFNNFKEGGISNYFNFIRNHIQVITIRINTASEKLFTIFESINSKGKRLEEIDLIKSYIFQNLDRSDYHEYLEKWGDLIWKTEDRLEDYFVIYIRANITFYKNDIKLINFKTLATGIFMDFYNKGSVRESLKAFIDDMLDKVSYYKMLSDFSLFRSKGISEKAEAFFRMNHIAGYRTTKFYLFKLLTMHGNYIEEDIFDVLVAYGFSYLMTLRTICDEKTENIQKTFKQIHDIFKELAPALNEQHTLGKAEAERMIDIFREATYGKIDSNSNLRDAIRKIRYVEHTPTSHLKIILSFLNACNSDNTINYVFLNSILERVNLLKIDTILPVDPNDQDNRYRYILRDDLYHLKLGQDFASSSRKKIPAAEFQENYIYRIGNLRLKWNSKAAKIANNAIALNDITLVYTSKKEVDLREDAMIEKLSHSDIVIRPDEYTPSFDKSTKATEREITSSNYNTFQTGNYKPVYFVLSGERIELKKKSWVQLLKSVFEKLWETHEEELSKNSRWKDFPPGSSSVWISNQEHDLRKPHCLGYHSESEYSQHPVLIETHQSGPGILVFCFDILPKLKISKGELTIVAKREK